MRFADRESIDVKVISSLYFRNEVSFSDAELFLMRNEETLANAGQERQISEP
jgi:hypothetical protein